MTCKWNRRQTRVWEQCCRLAYLKPEQTFVATIAWAGFLSAYLQARASYLLPNSFRNTFWVTNPDCCSSCV